MTKTKTKTFALGAPSVASGKHSQWEGKEWRIGKEEYIPGGYEHIGIRYPLSPTSAFIPRPHDHEHSPPPHPHKHPNKQAGESLKRKFTRKKHA